MAAPVYTSAGTTNYATGGATAVLPGTYSMWDALVVFVGQKETAGATTITCVTANHGLTKLGEVVATTGVANNDTGPMRLAVFWRVVDGTNLPASFGFVGGTSNVVFAQCHSITPSAGIWDSAQMVSGQDTTGDTTWSATATSSMTFAPDDFIFLAGVIPTDVTTPSQFSAEAITASGITFAAVSEIQEWDTTQDFDAGGFLAYTSVSSGSGTVAPTVTATAGGTVTNVYGPTAVVRLSPKSWANVDRQASFRTWENIGAAESISTNTLTRQATFREHMNIAVYGAFTIKTLGKRGWGYVLKQETTRQPPVPEGSFRVWINIT